MRRAATQPFSHRLGPYSRAVIYVDIGRTRRSPDDSSRPGGLVTFSVASYALTTRLQRSFGKSLNFQRHLGHDRLCLPASDGAANVPTIQLLAAGMLNRYRHASITSMPLGMSRARVSCTTNRRFARMTSSETNSDATPAVGLNSARCAVGIAAGELLMRRATARGVREGRLAIAVGAGAEGCPHLTLEASSSTNARA